MRRTALAAAIAALVLAPATASAAKPSASASASVCPFTFHVLHNDHIGDLRLRNGRYRIAVLNAARLSCQAASNLFTRFLEDFDGDLPEPWVLNVATATFRRGPGSAVGFRVRRVGQSGGGGHRHPQTGRFCPGTFQVLHNDRIGELRLPRGPYWIILLQRRGLSCAQASSLFTQFLDRPGGRLPSPWILEPQRARFRRGPGGVGFRVKPVS